MANEERIYIEHPIEGFKYIIEDGDFLEIQADQDLRSPFGCGFMFGKLSFEAMGLKDKNLALIGITQKIAHDRLITEAFFHIMN